jgi:uncharacterized protein (TIGR00730 family)
MLYNNFFLMPKDPYKDISEQADQERINSAILAGEVVNYRDSWRIFRIITEFVEGYQFLSGLKKEVTILGSARLPANNKYYKIAQELGNLLGKNGFTTITGGGPGIMEAANRGAFEAGGESVGLNIQLPFEQRINPYVKKSIAFYYFFSRKVMLTSPANAFVFFPGGFGTFHQLFEILTLIQTKKIKRRPIILYDHEFWSPLHSYIKKVLVHDVATIEDKDDEIYQIVDSPEAVMKIIETVV